MEQREEGLDRRELKGLTKLQAYNAMLLPTVLCGCEMHVIDAKTAQLAAGLEVRYLRRVEGVTWLDRVRNEGVRNALRQDVRGKISTYEVWRGQRKAWRQKPEQMDDERMVKKW